jgi:hypothetical protein
MTSITFVHPEDSVTIPIGQAITKCSLFQNNPTLTTSPYRIQSPVSLSIFREFISALEGNSVNITATNFRGLKELCEEFGFFEFSAKLSKFFWGSENSQIQQIGNLFSVMRNAQLRESIEFVDKGKVIESDFAEAAALFPAVREQLSVDGCARKIYLKDIGIESTDIRSLEFLLSGERISIGRSQGLLSSFLGNVSLERLLFGCSKADIQKNLSDLMIESRIDFESSDVSVLSVEALDSLLLSESISIESEDALLEIILKLGPGYRDLLRHIQIVFLSDDGFSLLNENFEIPPESVWQCAVEQITHPLPLNSPIISDFLEISPEFRGKQFSLLWRGSSDGFTAQEFHRRCDGHSNTVTVILDTKGNIFGGFTPVEWESGEWHSKADDSQKSFLFILKNPHNIPAMRFVLRAKKKNRAIVCDSDCGPCFYDLRISDNCNTNTESFAYFGSSYDSYINNTGLDGDIVFTGSKNFEVKEIEVFEMTD